MVTAEDIAKVEVFASLGSADCDRLSRAAADISLGPGEYAADPGSERALFAVLDGLIEAVQVVDGIERVVGQRQPGDVFGEVPIALGTVFPVGFRAAGASRVLRIEPADYHAVASVVPEVALEIGRLASHRMSGSRGLQGLAAEPLPPRAIVLGHRWDAACTELRPIRDALPGQPLEALEARRQCRRRGQHGHRLRPRIPQGRRRGGRQAGRRAAER